MAIYWIKLYCEILDDPKIGKMPEWLFARFVKLLLMAGREGKDGMLPPVEDMLWILRPLDEGKMLESLRMLEEVGVTHQAGDGRWCIVNFAKRQAAASPAERQRLHRQNVSRIVTSQNVTHIDTESESDIDSVVEEVAQPAPENKNVFRMYEQEIGPLTPAVSNKLKAAEEDYPAEWIILALQTSAINNARSWSYAEAILKRWKKDGFKSDNRKNGGGRSKTNSAEPAGFAGIREFLENYQEEPNAIDN